MALDIDEDYISLASTAAGLTAAALTVADSMVNGMVTTAAHVSLALGSFIMWRLTLGRALGRRRTPPAPAPAADDTPEDN